MDSQARASLKNPSRPYTPRSTARPLFHGDDYRPGSRPSSSYTVTEQKELQRKQSRAPEAPSTPSVSAPSASMLPPRSSSSKKKNSSTPAATSSQAPSWNGPEGDQDTASSNHLKLVHAPLLSPSESTRDTSKPSIRDDPNSDADSDTHGEDDHLEASLELPSQVRATLG